MYAQTSDHCHHIQIVKVKKEKKKIEKRDTSEVFRCGESEVEKGRKGSKSGGK